PGARVRATAQLEVARQREVAAVAAAYGPPRLIGDPSLLQQLAAQVRAGLRESVSGLPRDERGLVPALVVGDTSRMPERLTEQFRVTGLAHLTAVSGANVAIVLGAVLVTARWAGLRGRVVPVLGALALAGFVVLARPQPSVLRAAAMGLLVVIALMSGRRRQVLPALCAAVLALVLIDPWLARSFGFALSVLATAGLLVFAPGWRDALARLMPAPLADAIAVPAAAQVACAPLVAVFSERVSLLAVPANALVAPAVPPATLFGVVAAATGQVWAPFGRFFGQGAGAAAWWIVEVAQRGARVPGAAVGWSGGFSGGAALAAVLLICGAALPAVLRLRLPAGLRVWPHGGRALLAGGLAGVLVVVAGSAAVSRWPPHGWLLVACDVGQGDALVLSAGEGSGVVVDAGPDPRAVDRCLRDLGVGHVPLVLLTHFHADHVEGLRGVLRGRTVGEIQVGPLRAPPGEVRRVRSWAEAAGVPLTTSGGGEVRRMAGLTWRVLWPSRVIEGEGPNDASVVILAERAGVRMLLTGDIEPPAQAALLRMFPRLRVDVLKVPHHGSAYQAPQFARRLSPAVAVISVGEDNTYGHPAPATIRLLRKRGAYVSRTDRAGDVAVVGSGGRLEVVTRGRRVRCWQRHERQPA
ncbi:MAG: ComEC/Rec2 family competence protein, partial [Carbonactinosporaceae bacterium]